MLAHVVDPVLTYKENLEKALDKASNSVLAIKELCTQSEEYDFEEEHQTKDDLLGKEDRSFSLMLEKEFCCLKNSLPGNRLARLIFDVAFTSMS